MDGPATTTRLSLPPLPRLRLSRHAPLPPPDSAHRVPDYPQAGPSRLPAGPLVDLTSDDDDDDDDDDRTPRIPSDSSVASAAPVDTPAARLRALLARVPNHSQKPTPAPPTRPPAPPARTEPDSDFDAASATSVAPSIARESLKDLFSRALRKPGGTPERLRRNSIDTSEVEASPRVKNAETERTKRKNKRGSLSDDEVELSKSQEYSRRRSRSGSTIYDTLRARLASLQSNAKNPFLFTAPNGSEHDDSDYSEDTATLLRELKNPSPRPTVSSTPFQSMAMPSRMHMHSNLLSSDSEMNKAIDGLESDAGTSVQSRSRFSRIPVISPMRSNLMSQDTEMQRALDGLESEDGTVRSRDRTISGPSMRPTPARPNLSARPMSMVESPNTTIQANKGKQTLRRTSTESLRRPGSRTESLRSSGDYNDQRHELARERNRERELGWNRPKPMTPPKVAGQPRGAPSPTPRASPVQNGFLRNGRMTPISSPDSGKVNGIRRRESAGSVLDGEGLLSPKSGSFASDADYRERVNELDNEVKAERERNWNKPRPRLSAVNLKLHMASERLRTQSQPTMPQRPESAQSNVSSRSSHSRPGMLSPRSRRRPSSVASGGFPESIGDEGEFGEVLAYERERNWNNPHPRWELQSPSGTPLPPELRSGPPSPGIRTRVQPLSLARTRKVSDPALLSPPLQNGHALPTSPRMLMRSTSSQSYLSKTPPRAAPPKIQPKSTSRSPSFLDINQRSSKIPPPVRLRNGLGSPKDDVQNFRSRWNFEFPSRKSLPPLRDDDEDEEYASLEYTDAEPSPHTRSLSAPLPSVILGRHPGSSKIPVRSPKTSLTNDASSRAGPSREGDRRSTTGLQINFNKQSEERPRNGYSGVPSGSRVGLDEVFESDEESVRINETPILQPAPLEADEHSPVSSDASGSVPPKSINNDDEPVQAAISPENGVHIPMTPPRSPPPASEAISSLVTPPRGQTYNSSKMAFRTPSPPKGIPELPRPPSLSDEEPEPEEYKDQSPTGPSLFNFSAIPTPRPPGGWLATPAQPGPRLTRRQSMPDVSTASEASAGEEGQVTPVPSRRRPRRSSFPSQTPAPPGAWFATPGSRKKTPLKVRFQVSTSDSEAQGAQPPIGNGHAHQTNGHADSSLEFEKIPVARPLRKQPTIKIVDAFGRETADNEAPRVKQEDEAMVPPASRTVAASSEVSNVLRRRAPIKIVDAMGNEIKDEEQDADDVIESREEALERVRATITDMREDLGVSDKLSEEELPVDDYRLRELVDISRSARDTRNKVVQSLQLVQKSEQDSKAKFGPARRGDLFTKFNDGARFPFCLSFGSRWWTFVVLQLLILLLMYCYSKRLANQMFLTNYYDPFYPEFHPRFVEHGQLHFSDKPSWSFSSIPDSLQRAGLRGVFSDMWGNLTCILTDWRRTWTASGRAARWTPT